LKRTIGDNQLTKAQAKSEVMFALSNNILAGNQDLGTELDILAEELQRTSELTAVLV